MALTTPKPKKIRKKRKTSPSESRNKTRNALDIRQKLFIRHYLKSFNATEAAIKAGYAESAAKGDAWSWASTTSCPPNKKHLRDQLFKEIDKKFGPEEVDAMWVLKRAKLLADFNIVKFVRLDENGLAVYDFSNATPDDWYCIEEYATEQIGKAIDGELIPVSKLKIKAASKIAALKLIGDHISVQAFQHEVKVSGEVTQVIMTETQYVAARKRALKEDDC